MLKRYAIKMLVGLALLASLWGATALGPNTTAMQTAPTPHLQACGAIQLPPCF